MPNPLQTARQSASIQIVAGLAVGQGLIYLATPVISRIYDPSAVGRAGTFLAVASVVGAVATLRLEVLLARCDDLDVAWVLRSAMLSILLSSVICGICYGATGDGNLLTGIAMTLCVGSLATVALTTQMAARERRLSGLAASKVAQGVGQVVAQVSLGAARYTGVGLQVGYAVGYLAASGVQARALHWPIAAVRRDATRHREMVRTSLVLTVAATFNLLVVWSPTIALTFYFDRFDVGQLTVAQRLALVPAGLVVAALGPPVIAAFGHALRAGHAGWPTVSHRLRFTAPAGLLVAVGMAVLPTHLLVSFLGEQWRPVAGYLHALAPLVGGSLAIGPFSQLLALAGHVRDQLAWDAGRLGVLALAVVVAVRCGLSAAATCSVISVIVLVSYAAYVWLLRCATSRPTGPLELA